MPIRDEAINVFMGLPGDGDRLELTYNHGVDSYELGTGYNHIALTVDDLDGTLARAGGEGHRAGEAAVPGARGRLADLLRARSRRLPDRAHRGLELRSAAPVSATRGSAARRHRSRVELVPPRRLHLHRRLVEAHRRDLRVGARRRAPGDRRAAPARADASARSRRSTCSPTSAARRASSGCGRWRPRRSARRRTARRSCAPRASAPGWMSRCSRASEEARYGYLAVVNSTTLADGVALDIGGGSMQLTRVVDRPRGMRAPGGSARSSRRSASSPPSASSPSTSRRCGSTCAGSWPRRSGWASRTASAGRDRRDGAQPRGGRDARARAALVRRPGLPPGRVRRSTRWSSGSPNCRPSERSRVPGIKPERGDLILAGAVVVQTVMEAGGSTALEVTEAGLREGAFFEELLAGQRPAAAAPTCAPPRCATSPPSTTPTPRTPRTSRGSRSRSGTRSPRPALHPGDAGRARAAVGGGGAARRRHRRRLRRPPQALALPDPQRRPARLHAARDGADRPGRPLPPQGQPGLGEFAPLARKGDEALLARCSAALRLAEQLERPRDQTVRHARVACATAASSCGWTARPTSTVSRWAAQRQGDVFRRAFGKELLVLDLRRELHQHVDAARAVRVLDLLQRQRREGDLPRRQPPLRRVARPLPRSLGPAGAVEHAPEARRARA